ncbi:MAG TPA: serine/threonine-protein kinase, partial [Polyangiaceae bacterium]|nr:serine/threonine-protein kinase [Polyangiaceae bacterium]
MNAAPEPNLSQQTGDLAPGHVLDRYELLLPVAAGGMAMVWAARLKGTRGFQKIVAVKTMLPKLSEDEQFEQMFLDEASLASEVHHPHVVEILDLGEQQGVLFLVMEWIDGVPLNQLMKAARPEGGVPISVAVRIAMQACAGLHAAHELRNAQGKLVGLVHRDVSPQNILVTYEGVTKVVDFGVAKATAIGGGATVAGQIKGKVAYMAPEQIKGLAIDRRVDVFALGIVLYALTTGKHPFRRESEAATMYNICAPQQVMSPRKVIPDYPVEVEQIVTKALAKEPDKRYQTCNDMLRDLAQLPSALRASTDEEVGIFVHRLLNSKREERQAALANALALADEHAKLRQATMGYGSDAMRPSVPSAVSVVTGTGRSQLGDGTSGLALGTGVVAAGRTSARKRLVFASSVAAILLLGIGVIVSISSRSQNQEDSSEVSARASGAFPTVSPPPFASARVPEAGEDKRQEMT